MTESTLTCERCHTEADVKDDPHAWDGWTVRSQAGKGKTLCPQCQQIEKEEEDLERR